MITNFKLTPSSPEHKLNVSGRILTGAALQIMDFQQHSIEISPEIQKVIDLTKEFITDYMLSLGITTQLDFPMYAFLMPSNTPGNVGSSGLAFIKVTDCDVNNSELKLIILAKRFVHEFYHFISPTKFSIQTSSEDTPTFKRERTGLSYTPTSSSAMNTVLEESLAFRMESKLMGTLETQFSTGMKLYREIAKMESVSKKRIVLPELVEIFEADITLNAEMVRSCYTYVRDHSYLDIMNLLILKIPNFEYLVEDARINGNTLALARSIEKAFGPKTFKLIVTSPEKEIAKVMQILKESINN